MDRTLILVKPDAFARGLTGEIISRFERKGLRIAELRRMTMSGELAERHYAEHVGKPFFEELVEFITSGPLVAMVLEGESAVAAARQVIGATNPLEAAPGSIRGDFAIETGTNLVHGSDSDESATREIGLFFGLVLASRSPRRAEILERLGVPFESVPPDVEELTDGDPLEVAQENARRKARAVDGDLVVGADTVVALDERILPKPRDAGQAGDWLRALSGRTHRVVGGLCVVRAGREQVVAEITEVTFRELAEGDVAWYVASGEWEGKAGGYAIQGRGAALVERIAGDYLNVVGLPLPALMRLVPELLQMRVFRA